MLEAEDWDAKTTQSGVIGPHYLVHYKGWKKTSVLMIVFVLRLQAHCCDCFPTYRWDEWVPETRVLKDDKAGREKQSRLKEEALAAQKAARAAKSGVDKASSRSDAASPAPNAPVDKGKGPAKQEPKGKKRTRGEAFDTVCGRLAQSVNSTGRI